MLCTSGRRAEEELEGITGAQEIGRVPLRLQDGEETDSPSQAPCPACSAQSLTYRH